MSITNGQIGTLGAILIISLLGFQYIQIQNSQPIPEQQFSLEESGLLDELRSLRASISDIKLDLNTPHELLNNYTLADFIQEPLNVINSSTPYQQLHSNHAVLQKEMLSLRKSIGIFEEKTCSPEDHIYFLKTSKTGSTTIANILIRYGLKTPGTNFLFGESSNGGLFFSNAYMPFNDRTCFLGQNIGPNRPKFDISYVHMRYNRTAVEMVMKPDTKKISILRDPLTNFVSSWRYYNGLMKDMRQSLPMYRINHKVFIETKDADFISEMEEFLKDPHTYLKPLHFAHGAYMFTYHPQLLFFGYPTYLLQPGQQKLGKLVESWLWDISNDFDHILILEDLDTSLAVMMIKFCWDIKDVVHLKLNSMRKEEKTLSDSAKRLQRLYNWGDWMLYDFFVNKLKKEVLEIGTRKVEHYKNLIIDASERISKECIAPPVPQSANMWIDTPRLRPEKMKNQTCHLMTKDITGFIEIEQLVRWKDEYPEFYVNKPYVPKVVASIKEKKTPTERRKFAKMCLGPSNFIEFLDKNEITAREFFNWNTNKYDIRQEWSPAVMKFAEPLTEKETSYGLEYRKLWN